MKTVSFQGVQLSKGQRQRLEAEKHVKSFLNPVLQQQVQQTLKELEVRKVEGAKPERVWFLESQSFGTPSFAEYLGFEFDYAQLGDYAAH